MPEHCAPGLSVHCISWASLLVLLVLLVLVLASWAVLVGECWVLL